MKYLLDTDWIINLLAGNKDAEEKIEHLDPDDIDISLATVGEIYEGAYSYVNPPAHIHTFRQFLRHFQLLNLRHGSNGLDSVSARQPTFPRMSERSKALSQEQEDSRERLTNQWSA